MYSPLTQSIGNARLPATRGGAGIGIRAGAAYSGNRIGSSEHRLWRQARRIRAGHGACPADRVRKTWPVLRSLEAGFPPPVRPHSPSVDCSSLFHRQLGRQFADRIPRLSHRASLDSCCRNHGSSSNGAQIAWKAARKRINNLIKSASNEFVSINELMPSHY